jgi:uncharacterized protein with von Willebrand factor type A (vWA) domain
MTADTPGGASLHLATNTPGVAVRDAIGSSPDRQRAEPRGIQRALAPFLAFPPALRAQGFPAGPDRTQTFLAAVTLLGPRSLTDIRRAARATFAPGPEETDRFDAIFDAIFLGRALQAPAEGGEETLPPAFDQGGLDLLTEPEDETPSGAEATAAERLTRRDLTAGAAPERFARDLPAALPTRRARRLRPGPGNRPDPARAFRQMLRRDGEVTRLPTRHRPQRPRPVLLLIDVSGSMKGQTEGALRLAHALIHAAPRAEVFTLGTRLTRVTRALRLRDPAQALDRAAGLVADWDGGTRLGEALQTFLSVPRFASTARGAMVVILSDGLERGGPEALVAATARLRGLARHLLWLTPLAADPAYRPETAALRAVVPYLDALRDGSSPRAVAREILAFGRAAR